jgi:hypothetical protein
MAMKTRTLAAVLALGLSACAAEYSAVGIYAICAPPTPDTTTGACVYPATCSATFAGTPLLDTTTALLDFRLPVQMNNSLADNSSTTSGLVNTNDAFVQSFEITYAGAPLEPWNVAAAITIPTAGSSGALLSLIPYQYFASIPVSGSSMTQVLVSVRAHGVLGSQSSFTSAWFQIPVNVCAGCLQGVQAVCAAGSVPVYCPPPKPGQTSPGQSASFACLTSAAARE